MSGRVRFAHVLPQKVPSEWFLFDFIYLFCPSVLRHTAFLIIGAVSLPANSTAAD